MYESWFIFAGFFFFQAEDGIRDLVRSRGLGDVYKRQSVIGGGMISFVAATCRVEAVDAIRRLAIVRTGDVVAVSYTHLTLPTSDLV